MRSEGYGTWSVRLCVCLSDLNSGTTGNKVVHERYTHLQRNKHSKNNVADLAKTAEFWQEKPALPWTNFCDPTHQLARCACVFITCTTGSQPLEQHCPESCVAVLCYFKCRWSDTVPLYPFPGYVTAWLLLP